MQSGSLSTFVKIRLKIACRMFSDLSCCFRPAGSAQKFYWSKLLVRWIHVPNHTFQISKKLCRAKYMTEYIPNLDFKRWLYDRRTLFWMWIFLKSNHEPICFYFTIILSRTKIKIGNIFCPTFYFDFWIVWNAFSVHVLAKGLMIRDPIHSRVLAWLSLEPWC